MKFYVRRVECWGGTYAWVIVDRDTRQEKTKPLKSETAARKLCERMEADWRRYTAAMLDGHIERRRA